MMRTLTNIQSTASVSSLLGVTRFLIATLTMVLTMTVKADVVDTSRVAVPDTALPAGQRPALSRPVADTVLPAEQRPAPPRPVADTAVVRLPRREFLSLKTNVLLDVAYMPGYNRWCPIPNVAIEYYPLHGHFTYGASFDFPWWRHYDKHKFFELRNYQLETRYYFQSGDVHQTIPGQGAAYRGFYLQGYAHAGVYLFCFNADKGWTGEYLGGGVGFGYVMPLSKTGHWRLELGAQLGIIYTGYDPFQYEYRGGVDLHDDKYYYDWTLSPSLFKKRQYRYTWFGPTRVGITISYDLLYRRHARRGVSLKSYQEVERRYAP